MRTRLRIVVDPTLATIELADELEEAIVRGV
jgi:hypothetical protein